MALPSGTVTFLLTDIEGSTGLWEVAPEAMRSALERHDALLRSAVDGHGGHVFATGGDGVAAAFARAGDAVVAALEAQRTLAAEPWPTRSPLRVRMGIHTGEATERDGDYFGSAVNRTARLMGAGHGGQVLVSGATEALVGEALPEQIELVDMGEHRLRDLARPIRVFELVDGGRRGGFPALRTLDAFPGNLPLQVSSFVGRDRELERTAAALAESRVVTLTGVGGVGKTRLALQVAAEVLPRFGDGAWLCELAPVRDPTGVADALAAVFDVAPRAGQPVEQALVEFLRGKELMVVLDNCEHLLEPVARLASLLERSCPRLGLLATSREGLGIDGERILAVPSLAAPGADADPDAVADADAVRLFVERAQAVKTGFVVTADNAAAVAQVCRRLDGMPLAIELAAARIPSMNPGELARRLNRRFEVLAGGRRGAVERHQTLRAAIDWSYELLTDAQRRLLARLTVFAGGCTLEAAEAVCAGGEIDASAVWELLAGLVAQSLVVAEDQGLDTRYRLLETIRQYGEERIDEHGETAVLRGRHAEYYAGLIAMLMDHVLGPDEVDSLTRLAAEQENVLGAMSHAIDTTDVDLAFRLLSGGANPTLQSWIGFQLPAEPALGLPGADEHFDYPVALAYAGSRAALAGDLQASEQWCRQAIEAERRLATHPDGQVDETVAANRGLLAMSVGNWHDSAVFQEQAAALARSAGRLGWAAAHLCGSAQCRAVAGESDAALPLVNEGLALARRVGAPALIAQGLSTLANVLADRDAARARGLLRESLELATLYENTPRLTQGTLVAARLGDIGLTLELAGRAVRGLHWNGDRPQLSGVLNVIAWAAADAEPDSAAVLQGGARRLALAVVAAHGSPGEAGDVPKPSGSVVGLISDLRRQTSRRLADALGEERLHERRADGEAMDTDRVIVLALHLTDQAPRSPLTAMSDAERSAPGPAARNLRAQTNRFVPTPLKKV